MPISTKKVKKCIDTMELFAKQEGWYGDINSKLCRAWICFQGTFYKKYGFPPQYGEIQRREDNA